MTNISQITIPHKEFMFLLINSGLLNKIIPTVKNKTQQLTHQEGKKKQEGTSKDQHLFLHTHNKPGFMVPAALSFGNRFSFSH